MRKTWAAAIIIIFLEVISVSLLAALHTDIVAPTQNKFVLELLIASNFLFLFAVIVAAKYLSKKEKLNLILKEKNTTYQLKLSEYKKNAENLFHHVQIGIAKLSISGNILEANKTLCKWLGYEQEELRNINSLFEINDLHNLQINMQNLIENKQSSYQNEQKCFKKYREDMWVSINLSLERDAQGKPDFFIMQFKNINLQKEAEEKLGHMAYHDPLTGLSNRNNLECFVNQLLSDSTPRNRFALLFLDLDRFKNINDTMGHEAGDSLLQIVTERILNTVRKSDIVTRLGGDEFVIVIPEMKKVETVTIIAQKILNVILQPITINGQELYITTSIGISLYPFDGKNLKTLMKNADLALYQAKEHGRNNYQFYTAEMTNKTEQKMILQNAIGHALENNEFLLNFQPQMSLKNRQITGIEALLRWKNKKHGIVTPEEIITLAEETGLIIPVSDWILQSACQQLKKWHDMGFNGVTMSVNCSSRQFKQPGFVDEVLRVLNEVGISPSSLEIEITESLIMKDPKNALRVLYGLKNLGVQIVIDDFGTGYWSLGNLQRLVVNKIKIDKSFIKQLARDETSAAITSAIIAMANRLDIKSVAEGVETQEQYAFLAKEGCSEIQGYYLTRPLSGESMTKFLKHPVPDAEIVKQTEITT